MENNENTEKMDDGAAETLVVVSKLKNYVRQRANMNTSANVVPVLSEMIRKWCDSAIENAKSDGRKTVMDRDFPATPPM